ncbi:MAG: cytochrome c peroxidase [Dokdonella sp.]
MHLTRSISLAIAVSISVVSGSVCAKSGGERQADALVALGALLFADTSLSADHTISCASCHAPSHAFADQHELAVGTGGRVGTRNAPSLIDAGQRPALFWDGRRQTLEQMVLDPLFGPQEHGLRDAADLEHRVTENVVDGRAYAAAFGKTTAIEASRIAKALAVYVGTLQAKPSPFERFAFGKDTAALTTQQEAGYKLFRGRAGCTACHVIHESAAPLTDDAYHDQGIGATHLQANLQSLVAGALASDSRQLGQTIQTHTALSALGRFLVSHNVTDIGKFRTPSLRNVADTAPYMHDGSIATLRDAVNHELYYSAADRGAGFSREERGAIVAFLETMSSGIEQAPNGKAARRH